MTTIQLTSLKKRLRSLLARSFPQRGWGHKQVKTETSPEAGLSMIELVVVVAIVGGLTAMIIGAVTGAADGVREKQARLAFNQIESALQMYRLNHLKYPSTDQGLAALFKDPGGTKGRWRGPYANEELTTDPWGEEISYESDGRKFRLVSSGKDGESGTTDDLVYPEEEPVAE